MMIARDLILAEGVGARLHVPHVSTAGSVALDPRREGARRPRHGRGHPAPPPARGRVGPRLRPGVQGQPAAADPRRRRGAPRRRSSTGPSTRSPPTTPPHAPETKDQEWEHAPCGMLGLETAFAVVNTELVATGRLRPARPPSPGCTTGPASVRDVGAHGGPIAPGPPGAPRASSTRRPSWPVDAGPLRSRSRNSPFAGQRLTGRPVHTLLRGAFTLRDGHVGRDGIVDPVSPRDHGGVRERPVTPDRPALLVLEDGTRVPRPRASAPPAPCSARPCSTPGIAGYQEVLTDPSLPRARSSTMTSPHVGNYGIERRRRESARIQVAGFVVREAARRPSNVARRRSACGSRCATPGVVGIEGVDTRRLTRHLRDRGRDAGRRCRPRCWTSTRCVAQALGAPSMVGADLAPRSRRAEPYALPRWESGGSGSSRSTSG